MSNRLTKIILHKAQYGKASLAEYSSPKYLNKGAANTCCVVDFFQKESGLDTAGSFVV